MPDDTEATAIRARLEAIVKEAKDAEAQTAAARHRVQAARLLLEEDSKATALEQTATTARQRVPSSSSSSSSPVAASQLVPTASSTYEDTVVAGLHLQMPAVLNVRQLVNIILNSSSTNYANWRDLMDKALQRYALIKHVTDDTPSNDPGWIRLDSVVLNWISNSISADLHQAGNAAVQRATSVSPSRTSFSATVSNVPFTLTLPFTSLFRVTSRCWSTVASSRPWPTVLPT
jgi:hypothetical protein